MENKIKIGSINRVQVTDYNSRIKEYTSQNNIDRVTARSNERKYHQIERGGQLLEKKIFKLLYHGEDTTVKFI